MNLQKVQMNDEQINNLNLAQQFKSMGQIENVQRGIIFAFFVYSLIFLVAFIIKFVKNWVDKEAKVDTDDQDGAKYAEKSNQKKAEESNNELDASKKNKDQEKKKSPSTSSRLNDDATLDQIVLHIIKPTKLAEQQTLITRLLGKLREHVFYHLPFIFPIALNVAIGTSYAFIFVLFFFLQISYGLFNNLKIHETCVENKIIKCIAEHLGLILTIFAWVNVWGSMTSTMPFFITKQVVTL